MSARCIADVVPARGDRRAQSITDIAHLRVKTLYWLRLVNTPPAPSKDCAFQLVIRLERTLKNGVNCASVFPPFTAACAAFAWNAAMWLGLVGLVMAYG